MGHKRKGSLRAIVFRFAPESGPPIYWSFTQCGGTVRQAVRIERQRNPGILFRRWQAVPKAVHRERDNRPKNLRKKPLDSGTRIV
jgi:hypothetical protein